MPSAPHAAGIAMRRPYAKRLTTSSRKPRRPTRPISCRKRGCCPKRRSSHARPRWRASWKYTWSASAFAATAIATTTGSRNTPRCASTAAASSTASPSNATPRKSSA